MEVVIAIGSNHDHERNIAEALDGLAKQFGSLQLSPVYQSVGVQKSVEKNTEAPFDNAVVYYNLVVVLQSALALAEIKQRLTVIENQCHRQRDSSWVSVDLDVLLGGDNSGDFGGITLPHPDILECAYVLRPLADLLPTYRHPLNGQMFRDLWHDFPKTIELTAVDFVWHDQVVSTAAHLPFV